MRKRYHRLIPVIRGTVFLTITIPLWFLAGWGAAVTYFTFLFIYFLRTAASYSQYIELDNDEIYQHGELPQLIRKNQIVSCHYKSNEFVHLSLGMGSGSVGSLGFFVFDIRGSNGDQVFVYRYGWGSKQQQLFRDLNKYLKGSKAKIDPKTARLLKRLGN